MDGANRECLWKIGTEYYDLNRFSNTHPGGKKSIEKTRGTDCTNLFSSIHRNCKANLQSIKRLKVSDAETPVNGDSLDNDEFYGRLKGCVYDELHRQARFEGKSIDGVVRASPIFRVLIVVTIAIWCALSFFSVVVGSYLAAILWGFFAFAVGGFGHDAIHGATFKRKVANDLLAFFSLDLNLMSSRIFKDIHVYQHHLYTNVEELDPDLRTNYPILRETSGSNGRWFHRFQHMYAVPLYCISLVGACVLDITSLITGDWGNTSVQTWKYKSDKIFTIALKVFAISLWFIVPHFFLNTLHALLISFTMMISGGFIVNAAFAISHKQASCVLAPNRSMGWAERQVRSSSNFGPQNIVYQIFFAGLGFQIEHHLFPNISYSQLHRVSKTIKQEIVNNGLPYHRHAGFVTGLFSHLSFLKIMGRA